MRLLRACPAARKKQMSVAAAGSTLFVLAENARDNSVAVMACGTNSPVAKHVWKARDMHRKARWRIGSSARSAH